MKTITLHYKDENGVVRDTVWRVVPDDQVDGYLRCYVTSDRVVARVRDSKPGDLQRDARRWQRVLRQSRAA